LTNEASVISVCVKLKDLSINQLQQKCDRMITAAN